MASHRVAIGAALLVAPGAAGRRWLGDIAGDRRAKVLLRGLGARDLALGLGTYRALDRGEPVRPWVTMSMVGDLSDAVGSVLAFDAVGPTRSIATIASAGGAAALGAVAAPRVD